MLVEEILQCFRSTRVWDSCVQGCDIHGKQILRLKYLILVVDIYIPSIRLKAWVLNFMSVGIDCTSGCTATSRYSEMCSVGQLQAETIGPPGLLTLWLYH